MPALLPWLRFVPVLLVAAASAGPREVVREATRAVENDGAAPRGALWQERLDRDPNDRAALLGLATLARLAYDYPRAEALYLRLDTTPPDAFTAYAHLGEAWALEERGFSNGA